MYDPFGLYPNDSEERANGRLQAMEQANMDTMTKTTLDPLRLYSRTKTNVDISDALPFLPRPEILDRTMTGDIGFDPFNVIFAKFKWFIIFIRSLVVAAVSNFKIISKPIQSPQSSWNSWLTDSGWPLVHSREKRFFAINSKTSKNSEVSLNLTTIINKANNSGRYSSVIYKHHSMCRYSLF